MAAITPAGRTAPTPRPRTGKGPAGPDVGSGAGHLPQLADPRVVELAMAALASAQPVVAVDAPAPRDPLATSRAAVAGLRRAWRDRWAWWWPTVGVVAMAVSTGGGGDVAASVTAVAGAALWRVRDGQRIAGRTWLSARERRMAAYGCAGYGAAALATWVGAPWVPVWVAAAGGCAALTVPWVRSRRVRDPGPGSARSALAESLCSAWPSAVTAGSAIPELSGSVIVAVSEPHPGTVVLRVQLRPGGHSGECVTTATQWAVEAALRTAVGEVALTAVPEDVALVDVTVQRGRHLQRQPVRWTGLDLTLDEETGEWSSAFAVRPDGRVQRLVHATRDGARSLMCVGTSRSGKSIGQRLAIANMVEHQVTAYLDGKSGASAGSFLAMYSKTAIAPEHFETLIRIFHAAMKNRARRYASWGIHKFNLGVTPSQVPGQDPDPILAVGWDEALAVTPHLSRDAQAMLVEIATEGQGLGVRLVVTIHDMVRGVPGGQTLRDNILTRAVFRTGSDSAAVIAMTGLKPRPQGDLPDGGGWCRLGRDGAVVMEMGRTVLVDEDSPEVQDFLASVEPRQLSGRDLEDLPADLRAWYDALLSGPDQRARIAQTLSRAGEGLGEVSQEEWAVAAGRVWPERAPSAVVASSEGDRLVAVLRAAGSGGLARAEAARRAEVPPTSVLRHLRALAQDGVVEQVGGAAGPWRIVGSAPAPVVVPESAREVWAAVLAGALSVPELVAATGMAPSAVARCLEALAEEGLVDVTPDGVVRVRATGAGGG